MVQVRVCETVMIEREAPVGQVERPAASKTISGSLADLQAGSCTTRGGAGQAIWR
jgi:hypothetical protein